MAVLSDDDRLRWDARHRQAVRAPVAPPRLFAGHASLFPSSGKALELACGQGGTSVWLALRGLDVWGLDVSPVAIERARDLARGRGVGDRCRFDVVDLDAGLPDGPACDLVLCHLFRDARLDDCILERLAPGALLAIAVLSEVDAEPGPFRTRRGELLSAFGGLDVIATGERAGHAWLLARAPMARNAV